MKYTTTQNLDRTILSRNFDNYSEDELRTIFKRLNNYQLQRWMEHFVNKEAYEVCGIIKEVMEDVKV